MKKAYCLIFFGLLVFSFAHGPDTLWTRYYNGIGNSGDKAYSIHQTLDGGYVIVGYSEYFGEYLFLIRINSNGDTIWTRRLRYFDDHEVIGREVDVTNDGGYIVAAGVYQGFWLLKFSETGDTLWTKTFYTQGSAYTVKQTNDNGYIIGGSENGNYAMLIKTDSLGNEEWRKRFGPTGDDNCFSLIQTSDGNYLFGGYAWHNYRDLYLVKINPYGDTIWTRIYGDFEYQICHAVIETSDHYYIAVGGYGEEFKRFPSDAYITKWDANGNLIWERIFGYNGDDVALGVTETPDHCYAICGRSCGTQYFDFYIIKMDPNGDTLWTEIYSIGTEEWAHGIIATPDGGYLVCGWGGHGSNGNDVLLVKLKSEHEINETQPLNSLPSYLEVSPNPFQYRTKITFRCSDRAQSINDNLRIYNSLGVLVKTFKINPIQPSCDLYFIWDGRDDFGNILPAGVYFLKYLSYNHLNTNTIILL